MWLDKIDPFPLLLLLLLQMSGPMSAFARYAQEPSSPPSPQMDSVLPASRKRKRVSMAQTNGHSKENQPKKNRSKSLQPSQPISLNNGQAAVLPQPPSNKKAKQLAKKILSPAYPTPFPPRRVIVSESPRSSMSKSSAEENGRPEENEVSSVDIRSSFTRSFRQNVDEEESDDDDGSPFSAWLHDHVPIEDSTLLGQHLFGLLISPVPAKQFIKRTWQREPLLLQRKQANYYNGLFSTSDIDEILREYTLEYGENIDLTLFNPTTLKKERHNPEGNFDQLFAREGSMFRGSVNCRSCSTSGGLGCLQRRMLDSYP